MEALPPSTASSLARESSKRKRHSTDSAKTDNVTSLPPKRADIETALEVDIMILDYQAYNTTRTLLTTLDDADLDQTAALQRDMDAMDAFMVIFKHRHSGYQPDLMLRSRILLLQFCSVFCHRFRYIHSTPCKEQLALLREANKTRAKDWVGSIERLPTARYSEDYLATAFPLSQDALHLNRMRIIADTDLPEAMAIEATEWYGTAECVSLLDILPLFIQTVAIIRSFKDEEDVGQSLRVVIEFIMQACLEQYLIFGSEGFDAVDEAFAWGEQDVTGMSASEQEVLNLFSKSSGMSWQQLKEAALSQLCGSGMSPASILPHFDQLAAKRPMLRFEHEIRRYLQLLFNKISDPVLVQVEQGRLQGMSAEQSQKLLHDCGLG